MAVWIKNAEAVPQVEAGGLFVDPLFVTGLFSDTIDASDDGWVKIPKENEDD